MTSSNDRQNHKNSFMKFKVMPWIIGAGILLAVFSLWLNATGIMTWYLNRNPEIIPKGGDGAGSLLAQLGQLGDSFAAIGFVLNAVSLVFLGFQLQMQRKELQMARNDAREQNDNIKKQAQAQEAANRLTERQIVIQELTLAKGMIERVVDRLTLNSGGNERKGTAAISFIAKAGLSGAGIGNSDLETLIETVAQIQKIHLTLQQNYDLILTDDDGILMVLPNNYMPFESHVATMIGRKNKEMERVINETRQRLSDNRQRMRETKRGNGAG